MSRQDNNIDILVNTHLENASIPFSKEASWQKLQQKRAVNKRHKIISYALAASIVLAAILIIKPNYKPETIIVNEFEKRQKLEEFEKKMSGTYIKLEFCFDCNGTIIKSKVEQVPENSMLLIN